MSNGVWCGGGQTLTQQQRNNKRQRASPRQLAFLRKSFKINPRPDQTLREIIGRKIDMTPRSVQIWFQNNRAKLKNLDRLQTSRDLRTVTVSCSDHISRVQLGDGSYSPMRLRGTSSLGSQDITDVPPQTVPTKTGYKFLISSESLTIGDWRRTKEEQGGDGLWIYFKEPENFLYYVVMHQGMLFGLDLDLSNVKSINVLRDPLSSSAGYLIIQVHDTREIQFRARYAGQQSAWEPCNDFTDGQSQVSTSHEITGDYEVLQTAMQALTRACQSYEFMNVNSDGNREVFNFGSPSYNMPPFASVPEGPSTPYQFRQEELSPNTLPTGSQTIWPFSSDKEDPGLELFLSDRGADTENHKAHISMPTPPLSALAEKAPEFPFDDVLDDQIPTLETVELPNFDPFVSFTDF